MFNWKSIDVTYIYDGSFYGLLTIVFDCYLQKQLPLKVISQNHYELNMLDHILLIKTDDEKAMRIFNGLSSKVSYDVLYWAYHAFLNHEKKELEIIKYIIDAFLTGSNINTMLSIDYVLSVYKLKRNTLFEAHRLKGLVRFREIGNDLFYSSIHPDNDVIEIVGEHFTKRLSNQAFILHDKNRNTAMIYNKKEYSIIDLPNDFKTTFSEEEKIYQNLWKTFYKTIAIKERTNRRCQMNFMPKKYWKDLIEDPY